jgi:hypothetical protein
MMPADRGQHLLVRAAPEEAEQPLLKEREAIPVRGRGCLKRCEMLRIPHCLGSRLIGGGKVVSPTHRPHFTPKKQFFI